MKLQFHPSVSVSDKETIIYAFTAYKFLGQFSSGNYLILSASHLSGLIASYCGPTEPRTAAIIHALNKNDHLVIVI